MKMLNILILLLIINTPSREQDFYTDQEEVDNKPIFTPGIYLTFNDFINNYPVEPSQIQTNINSNSRDFYNNLLREEKVNVAQGDSVYSINPQRMWGYSDGKGVYMNRNVFPKGFLEYGRNVRDISVNPWAKINILGTLSLIYYIKNIQQKSSSYYYPSANGRITVKGASFILNTVDGEIYKATLDNLGRLINHDAELLSEFKNYREDQDIKLYIFLRKYNEKYPINFH